MQQVEGFCLDNCERVLEGGRASSDAPTAEFSLETHELHREYVALVEGLLEQHVAALGLAADEFAAVIHRCHAGKAGAGGRFIRTVESLTDFDVFVTMMNACRIDGCLS